MAHMLKRVSGVSAANNKRITGAISTVASTVGQLFEEKRIVFYKVDTYPDDEKNYDLDDVREMVTDSAPLRMHDAEDHVRIRYDLFSNSPEVGQDYTFKDGKCCTRLYDGVWLHSIEIFLDGSPMYIEERRECLLCPDEIAVTRKISIEPNRISHFGDEIFMGVGCFEHVILNFED